MKISQEVRDLDTAQIAAIHAADQKLTKEAKEGMEEMSKQFKQQGSELYSEV
jgi:phosphomethylpyrimidine synthase